MDALDIETVHLHCKDRHITAALKAWDHQALGELKTKKEPIPLEWPLFVQSTALFAPLLL